MPPDLRLLNYIDRFGVEAVMGRKVLYAHEMRRMIHSENLVNGYKERSKANAAEWVEKNQGMAKLLREAQRMVEDG